VAATPRVLALLSVFLGAMALSGAASAQNAGLVAAFNFNEGSGTRLNDLSGNNNNGTLNAGVTWSTAGKFGGAAQFNGTSGIITIPDAPSLRLSTGMTLEAWVYPTTSNGGWRDVIYKGNDNYFLEALSTQKGAPAAGGTFGITYGTAGLARNTWTHLAATYDKTTLRMFVNGVQVSSIASTATLASSSNPLQIGGDSLFGQYFQGLIDEVRVYNRALSQAEIQSDMNTPVTSTAGADTIAPTIAISSPTTASTFSTGTTPLALSGTASDNVGVTQVSWTNDRGGSGVATGTTSWSISGVALQSGANVITVTARDAANNTASATLTVTYTPPDTTPPVLAITAPTTATTYAIGATPISLSGTASDNVGVTQVSWTSDRGGSGTATGTTNWSISNIALQAGANVITVTARDAANNTTSAVLTVTYTPPDTTPPTIAITAPSTTGTFSTTSSPIALSGTASDNLGVTQVSWTSDRGGSGTATGTTSWSISSVALQAGANVITVTARDAASNTATAVLTITYSSPDTTPPVVSLTSPSPGATVSGPVTITASATDNVGVAGVQILLDNVALGAEVTTLPYSLSWDSTTVTNGVHTLSARARDAAGNTTLAAGVTVTVSNSGASSGLVAAYAFSEGTGTAVADASGNGNNGTLNSGVTWSTQGRFGNALSFNGTTGFVTVPDAPSLRLTGTMTLEAWVYPTSLSGSWRDVIYKGNDNYYLEALSTQGGAPATGGTFGETYGLSALALNTWSHLAATYDRVTLRLYVNGVQVASRALTGPIATSNNPLQIGGDSIYGQYFQGLIDEVRVYNRVLSQAEIQTDMNTAVGAMVAVPDTQAPSVPANVTATASSNSQIALNWSASTDNVATTGYLVERCQGSGCSNFVQIGTAAATNYVDSGLLSSTTYAYRIRATDAASNLSGYSAAVSQTTLAGAAANAPVFVSEAHSAVEGPSGTSVNSSTLNLNVSGPNPLILLAWHAELDGGIPDGWTVTNNGVPGTKIVDTDGYFGGAGNRRFRIYYWKNLAPGTNTLSVALNDATGVYTGPNELAVSAILLNNVDQTNPIRAIATDVSATARTGESETVTSTTSDLVVHVIAEALLTTGTLGAGETSVSLANDGKHPADGDASLWLSTKPGQAGTTTVSSSGWASRVINGVAIAVSGAPSSAAADLTVVSAHQGSFSAGQSGATYTLTVSNAGSAATSGAVSVTDSLPSGLTLSAISGTGWSCSVSSASCSRSDSLAAGGSYPPITLTVNVAANAPASVTNAVTVSGGADANTNNNSATDVTVIVSGDTTPPTQPGTLTASATSGTQVALSWGAATDNVGVLDYRVERCQGATCTVFVKIAVAPATPTTFNDSGLTPNTSYSYVVRAEDAAGNLGAYSNVATVTTLSNVPELVAAYSFEEGSGTIVSDSSGKGNNGTIQNATWSTAGKYGKALSFNGTNALVTIPNSASLQLTNAMTLEAWINPSASASTWRDVIYKGNDNYYLEASSNRGGLPAVGGTFGQVFGNAPIQPNTWTHLAVTYDKVTLRLYINGVQVASAPYTTPIATSTNPLQLGGDSIFSQYFQGLIDEVRIYNLVRTPTQIQADMNIPIGAVGLPAVSLSPDSLTFASQPTNSTSNPQTVTLTNVGSADLSITSIGVQGVNSADFNAGSSCGAILPAGSSCVVSVTFTPSAGGSRVASLTVTDNAPGSPHTVPLSGTGNATSGLLMSPSVVALTLGQTQQFSVNGTNPQWAVDGIVGGNNTIGTITTTGLYTAPATVGPHTVTALVSGQPQPARATVYVSGYPGKFTHHNDNARTGRNLNETVLTPTNVTASAFGKLFSYPLDGLAYASPLYMSGVNIPGQGVRNVLYVATQHNSVYAFDADGRTSTPLWSVSFINPAAGVTTVPAADTGECCDITPEIGITSTPVIDPVKGTIYVVAKTKEVSGTSVSYVQRLHALDITTGAERPGSPVVLQASIPGTGNGSVGGRLSYDALRQNQRPALLLSNGVVYIASGSHGDNQPYHGWLLGYDATSLQQVLAYCTSPNADRSGIWMSNAGPAADAAGNIYLSTANGTFDPTTGAYGDSVLKLSPSGAVLDYFAPGNQATLNASNNEIGAGGVMLIPDQPGLHPRMAIIAGKNATIHLLDRDSLGHFTVDDSQVVQSLPNIFPFGTPEPGNYSAPVYYNGTIYFSPVADAVKAFPLSNGLLPTFASSQSTEIFPYPGGSLAVSANGNTGGILWASEYKGATTGGVLRAYDPANLGNEVYNSGQASTRDKLGPLVKFSAPLVANGKVYVTGATEVVVFGLLP
jgi:hypothetical protein